MWKIGGMYHLGLNPADEVLRGVSAEVLADSAMWLKGPEFLLKPSEEWPKKLGEAIKITKQISVVGEESRCGPILVLFRAWARGTYKSLYCLLFFSASTQESHRMASTIF